MREIIPIFLLFSLIIPSSFAEERFNGGVSFDYERKTENEAFKIQKSLPSLEKDFIDLNYSIEYKPLNLLGADEVVIKKAPNALKVSYPNRLQSPDSYEISFSTGKTRGNIAPSNRLEYLLAQDPNNRELLFALSIQLKNENNLKEALLMADRALEVDPDFALAHFLRGDILRNLERFKEAVDEYIYTTQINPYCADAYYNIAKILELLDDRELALDYYKTAYQINPNDLEIRDIILKRYIDL